MPDAERAVFDEPEPYPHEDSSATEQGGVSPASAGGAPALDRFRSDRHNEQHVYEGDTEIAVAFTPKRGRQIVEALNDLDSERRIVANRLHAIIGDGDCVRDRVGIGHVRELLRGVEDLVAAMSDANRPRAAKVEKPDPRDAEIERLRAELAEIRDAAALQVNCTLAELGERSTLDVVNEITRRWRDSMDRGFRDSERWRKRAEAAEAERDRLRAKLDQHLADENSAQAANDRLRNEIDLARRQYRRAVNTNNDLVAERDRLRIALDIADGYQPKFQPGQYVRIGSCEGMVVKPKDITRVQLLGMLQEVDYPTSAVKAIPDEEVPF